MTFRFRAFLRESLVFDRRCDLEVSRVAEKMGLSRRPGARLASGTVSPMLWGLGRQALVLFPPRLFATMSPERRATLIAHELAHYQRGGQWVRLLELVVTGLYWWHPVVWWARCEIEFAEEQCCDAWVVEHCAGKQRTYAEALLETVDFLAAEEAAPTPVGASGIGGAPLLHRRLTEIINGKPQKSVRFGGRCLVGAVALIGFPSSPVIFSPPDSLAASSVGGASNSQHIVPRQGPRIERHEQPKQTAQVQDNAWPPSIHVDKPPADAPFWARAISANRRYTIEVRRGYRAVLHDTESGRNFNFEGERLTCVAFAPDSVSFISGTHEGDLRIRDSATGATIRQLGTLEGAINSVAYAPNGQFVSATGESGRVVICDLQGQTSELEIVANHEFPLRCVRFSPDAKLLVFVSDSWLSAEPAKIEVWDVAARRRLNSFATPTSAGALGFHDQHTLLVADWNGVIWHQSVTDGQVRAQTRISKDLVSAASFSSDTRVLEVAISAPSDSPL